MIFRIESKSHLWQTQFIVIQLNKIADRVVLISLSLFFFWQATIYRQLTILVNELQWQISLDNSFFTVFARFKSSDLTNRATPTRNSSLAMRLTFRSLFRFSFQLSIARRLMLWRSWPSVEVEMEASQDSSTSFILDLRTTWRSLGEFDDHFSLLYLSPECRDCARDKSFHK